MKRNGQQSRKKNTERKIFVCSFDFCYQVDGINLCVSVSMYVCMCVCLCRFSARTVVSSKLFMLIDGVDVIFFFGRYFFRIEMLAVLLL